MTQVDIDKAAVFTAAEDSLGAGGSPQLADIAAAVDAPAAAVLPALTEWRIRQAINSGAEDPWGEIVAALAPLEADAMAIAGGSTAAPDDLAARAGELARELAAAQADAAASAQALAAVEAEREAALAEAAVAREAAEAATERASDLEAALSAAADDADAMETSQSQAVQLADTLRAANERLGEASRARDAATAQAKREQVRAAAAEGELERLRVLRDETADTLADAMEARLSAETDSDALHERVETLQAELDDLAEREIAAREEVDRLQAAASSGGASGDVDWTLNAEDWPELPRQLAIATARIAALRAERDALRAHLDDARTQIDALNGLLEIRLSSPTTIIQAGGGGEPQAVGGAPAQAAANSGGRARLSIVRKQ